MSSIVILCLLYTVQFLVLYSIYVEWVICCRPSVCLSVCHTGGSDKNSGS